MKREKSLSILKNNESRIPGGVVSMNRKAEPNICFTRGLGSRVWDVDSNEYIDYQAGFAAALLGHNDADINDAISNAIAKQTVLMGAGPTDSEGELAEMFCKCVPTIDKIEITTSGSEATYHAVRIARAATGKDHIIIIQGGYNGWHNDVVYNVISQPEDVGPRVCPGEYPVDPLSAGIPDCNKALVHVVNFNDLKSVEYVLARYPVACILLEPILQNIGVVKPANNYLQQLRQLAYEKGFLLIFDEVKTGFRHALGGYQSICGVKPDLSTFGKAVANGFPVGIIGGKSEYMDYFNHPEKSKRVLIAGTYNAHPLATAATIATIQKLSSESHGIYKHLEKLGTLLENGLNELFSRYDQPFFVSRQGSAFCVYFMDHAPVDFHDILMHHNFSLDKEYRLALINDGIFNFPLPIKQGSISAAHSVRDIEETIEKTSSVLRKLFDKNSH